MWISFNLRTTMMHAHSIDQLPFLDLATPYSDLATLFFLLGHTLFFTWPHPFLTWPHPFLTWPHPFNNNLYTQLRWNILHNAHFLHVHENGKVTDFPLLVRNTTYYKLSQRQRLLMTWLVKKLLVTWIARGTRLLNATQSRGYPPPPSGLPLLSQRNDQGAPASKDKIQLGQSPLPLFHYSGVPIKSQIILAALSGKMKMWILTISQTMPQK